MVPAKVTVEVLDVKPPVKLPLIVIKAPAALKMPLVVSQLPLAVIVGLPVTFTVLPPAAEKLAQLRLPDKFRVAVPNVKLPLVMVVPAIVLKVAVCILLFNDSAPAIVIVLSVEATESFDEIIVRV